MGAREARGDHKSSSHCTPTLHCPCNDWGLKSSDVVLRDTIFHQVPYTTHTQEMPGNGDEAGSGAGNRALAAAPILPLSLGHLGQGGCQFRPLHGPPSISLSGKGKNLETTREMHLPLLLRLESGPPRMASFSAQGKGVRRKVGGPSPQVHTTVYRARWTGNSCPVSRAQLLLDPPPPLPCACHYHQRLQHRHPHPMFHLEPSRGSGWTPYQIWLQGLKAAASGGPE